MFAHEDRIHHTSDIDALYRRARHHRAGPLLISLAPSDHEQTRATVIVSKKFSPRATARNRQKRILRAALRAALTATELLPPHDIAIAYTRSGKMLSYEEASALIMTALTRHCRGTRTTRPDTRAPERDRR